MALSVQVPKTVRIKNHRLALVHFLMVASLLASLVYFLFFQEHGYEMTIPITTSLEIRWDEPGTIEGMENYFTDMPPVIDACRHVNELTSNSVMRWGHNFSRRVACSRLCKLDDVLNYADPAQPCWSNFKKFGLGQMYTALQFMESRGGNDIFLITAKNDWVVNPVNATRTNYVEVVPQGMSGVIDLAYRYQYMNRPSPFPLTEQHAIPLRGSNSNALTVLLGPDGQPVGEPIPAGQPIKLTVSEIFRIMQRPDGGNESGPTAEDLVYGAEVGVEASCFGTDRDVNTYLRDQATVEFPSVSYGADLAEPVCIVRFVSAGGHYQVAVDYTSVYSLVGETEGVQLEVVSETMGFYFRVTGGAGASSVKDTTTLLLNVASMLVFLSLPTVATSFIAVRLLGPISQMYKRTIIEPYDIEEQSAGIATVLAANVSSFHKLATHVPDGEPLIKLETIMTLMGRALESRSLVLDERETASLSYFLYDRMHRRDPQEPPEVGHLWPDCGIAFQFASEAEEKPRADGITLDQWNQVRLDCEKVTFDAIVHLFDKDRQRHCLEKFFTPTGIRKALLRAMTSQEREQYDAGSNFVRTATAGVTTVLDRVGVRSSVSQPQADPGPSPTALIEASRSLRSLRGSAAAARQSQDAVSVVESDGSAEAASEPERDDSGVLITPPPERQVSPERQPCAGRKASLGQEQMEAAVARRQSQVGARSHIREDSLDLSDQACVGKTMSLDSASSGIALNSFLHGSGGVSSSFIPEYASSPEGCPSSAPRCLPRSLPSGEPEAMMRPAEPEPGPEPRPTEIVLALQDVEQRLGVVELAVRRLALPEPAASSNSPPGDAHALRMANSEPSMHHRQHSEESPPPPDAAKTSSDASTQRRQHKRRWQEQQLWAKAIMESFGPEIDA